MATNSDRLARKSYPSDSRARFLYPIRDLGWASICKKSSSRLCSKVIKFEALLILKIFFNTHLTSRRSVSKGSRILADITAGVTELQKNLMGTAAFGNGGTVAVVKRKALAFYCVPADECHAMVDRLDDIELNTLA